MGAAAQETGCQWGEGRARLADTPEVRLGHLPHTRVHTDTHRHTHAQVPVEKRFQDGSLETMGEGRDGKVVPCLWPWFLSLGLTR